jgi:dipeptidyl aminopeptidase/acylaminoacyl peptidase
MAGDADLRAPESEAIQMYTALKLLGKETMLMLAPAVTHESAQYRPSMFLQECGATLAWFDSHRKTLAPSGFTSHQVIRQPIVQPGNR